MNAFINDDGSVTANAAQTVLPPRNCDPEVAGIMDELSRLQTFLVLKSRGDMTYMSAADLVQRTRCLIVERCYNRPPTSDVLAGEG